MRSSLLGSEAAPALSRVADALRPSLVSKDGGVVNTRKYDEWTVERWRLEPRYVLEFDEPVIDKAPPLWKDLTLAAIFALVLMGAAVAAFG